MSVKERLQEFIKFKGISTRSFCRTVGVSETYVSSMRSSIQPEKLHNIIEHFPELNPLWLMTGEGTMLRDASNSLMPRIEKGDFIDTGAEVFKNKLLEMFMTGEIYSRQFVTEMTEMVSKLNLKIAVMEKELKECRADCKIYEMKHGKNKNS